MTELDSTNKKKHLLAGGARLVMSLSLLIVVFYNQVWVMLYPVSFYLVISVVWLYLLERRYHLIDGSPYLLHFRLFSDAILLTIFVYFTGNARSLLLGGYIVFTALSSVRTSSGPGRLAVFYSVFFSLGLFLSLYLKILPPMDVTSAVATVPSFIYVFIAPILLGLGCLLVHRAVFMLYSLAEASRLKAEGERRESQLALVMTERARYELEAFNEFARKLNSSGSFDEIIEQIFEYIKENFRTEASVLYLLDQEKEEFTLFKSAFPTHVDRANIEFLRTTPISADPRGGAHWRAYSKKRYVFYPQMRQALSEFDAEVVERFGLKSILLIPLIIREEVFGVIDFCNYTRKLDLSREDIASIAAFCEHIAGAVKSSLLVHEAEESQRRAEESRKRAEEARHEIESSRLELQRLIEFSRHLNSSNNMDQILNWIFEYIENTYDVDGIWLQFIDSEEDELYTYKTSHPEALSEEQLNHIRALRAPLTSDDPGISLKVYRRKKAFYMARRPEVVESALDKLTLETLGINFCLYVPLIINDEVTALISFTRFASGIPFSKKDVASLIWFCEQISGAINNSHLHTETELSRMMAEHTLDEVRTLKNQQDMDYYLTSNLIEPLARLNLNSNSVRIEQLTRQKKSFPFKRWHCEIGGDINLAHTIHLKGRPYTVFLNADAMGKSLQGAGGILVLGSVFRIIVERTRGAFNAHPETWLRNTYLELDNIFRNFEGSMYITALLGLLDDLTGFMYFINAQHPRPVLYRNGQARFITENYLAGKFGFLQNGDQVAVDTLRLVPGDQVICGSDGRDEYLVYRPGDGRADRNFDENLFLRHIEAGKGDVQAIFSSITKSATLTDDISLLSVRFDPPALSGESMLVSDPVEAKARLTKVYKLFQEKKYREITEVLDEFCARVLEEGRPLYDERDDLLSETFQYLIRALMGLRSFERARRFIREYLLLHPWSGELLYLAALCDKGLKDFKEAAEYGERVLIREPYRQDNRLLLVEIYIGLNNRRRAETLLQELIAMSPDNSELSRVMSEFNQAFIS